MDNPLKSLSSTPKTAGWVSFAILQAGALLMSKTFHRDFGLAPGTQVYLVYGWLAHIVSFVTALLKLWAYGLPKYPEQVSGITRWFRRFPESAWWSFISFFSFMVGVSLLWWFVRLNIEKLADP